MQMFDEYLSQISISLTDSMKDAFQKYYEILVEENEKYNLTALTSLEDVYMKHFYDSILLSTVVPITPGMKLLDIGAGAGFPSVPLLILYPEISVTIVDSLGKRIHFLELLKEKLSLKNLNLVLARAEELDSSYRESFDLVTARAVARLNILDELTIPYVKKDGYFVAMKGTGAQEELEEAKKGIQKLGGEIEGIEKRQYLDRTPEFIKIKKVQATPASYPRAFAQIKKKPLA